MGEIRIIPVASQHVFLNAVKVQSEVIKEFGLRRKEIRSQILKTGSNIRHFTNEKETGPR